VDWRACVYLVLRCVALRCFAVDEWMDGWMDERMWVSGARVCPAICLSCLDWCLCLCWLPVTELADLPKQTDPCPGMLTGARLGPVTLLVCEVTETEEQEEEKVWPGVAWCGIRA
jgi:hypothetical protein